MIRRFRKWIYTLICEEASIQGQASLWMPFTACDRCKWSIMAGARFCPYCGALQEREEGGPETEPRYTVLVGGQPQRMRLNGYSPTQAYRRLVAHVKGGRAT